MITKPYKAFRTELNNSSCTIGTRGPMKKKQNEFLVIRKKLGRPRKTLKSKGNKQIGLKRRKRGRARKNIKNDDLDVNKDEGHDDNDDEETIEPIKKIIKWRKIPPKKPKVKVKVKRVRLRNKICLNPKRKNMIELKCVYYCHVCDDGIQLNRDQLREHLIRHGIPERATENYFNEARCKPKRSNKCRMCEVCYKTFTTGLQLQVHLKSHNDQYYCDVCNLGFKQLIDYTYHVKEHAEDQLYQCPLCEYKIGKRPEIKSHLYTRHEQFKRYKCDQCDKRFGDHSRLKEHKAVHTGEKPFQCDQCGMTFVFNSALKSHKNQKHPTKPEKNVECPVCHKLVSAKSYSHHKQIHSGKVICDICGRTLSSSKKLSEHMKTHSEERPYKCKYCDMSFKKYQTRTDHQRVHTGEKPFECPVCKKMFSQQGTMVRHWRLHNKRESFSCHICLRDYITEKALAKHIETVCQPIEQSQNLAKC